MLCTPAKSNAIVLIDTKVPPIAVCTKSPKSCPIEVDIVGFSVVVVFTESGSLERFVPTEADVVGFSVVVVFTGTGSLERFVPIEFEIVGVRGVVVEL